jgi:hypothetical protein
MMVPLQTCELQIGGVTMPLVDFSLDEPPTEVDVLKPIGPFTWETKCKVDSDFGLDLSAFLPKRAPMAIKFTALWYGGKLTTWMDEAYASDTSRRFDEVTFDGYANRCLWELGGARVGWQPGAVAVAPCVRVTA